MSLVVPACSRNAPSLDWITPMTPLTHSPLRRFVADGLRDTIDSYTTGELPLHRFAWELDTRLRTLAELTALPEWRALATLHEARNTIATVDTDLRASAREDLTTAEQHSVASAVSTLRGTLARIDPPDPSDPAAPALQQPIALAEPTGRGTAGGHRIMVA
jgi:hypothetical protein